MNDPDFSIVDNLARVRERMNAALERSGRNPGDALLVVVTKTQDIEQIRRVINAGATDIGENYIQEAEEKYSVIGDAVRWHFIGHLQKNKARHAVRIFDTIQSVDSLELAREIGRRAVAAERAVNVLIEVNVSQEETKFGVYPEGALALAERVAAFEGLRICGFMGMAPFARDPEESRPYFRQLKRLWDKLPEEQRRFLSMGMTGDYEVALEEGSNMVRIGTAVFGPRNA